MSFDKFWEDQVSKLKELGISQAEMGRIYDIAQAAWFTAKNELSTIPLSSNSINLNK